ncbi:sulfotransferase family protein [Pleurocapsa sp. CCALA 161]|uniref:sulfotransferase family protein n=1 Tax=Pleurocapsa sp. CCALA 161 TaxID=2107688 RepID=UPI000D060959|nr:sulfotransferase domain-containing protein [Pleurocapsa sp. CCALA 161]PSB09552.1 sulfotransferase family protein [Pleurocapsa sp. CCALA 161]
MKNIDNFILIIGSMKSGTTSLYNYLVQHPQIASCVHKEPNFFAFDHHWNKGFEWYSELWEDWDKNKHEIALEASTNYTKKHSYPYTVERIKYIKSKYKIKFKFIYLVRNPIKRIESHYTYAMTTNDLINLKKLSEGIDDDLIETSKYARQISEFYKAFSQDQILMLEFDELKNTPNKTLWQVCSFLDIEPNYQFRNLDKVYNPTYSRIMDVPWWIKLKRNKLAKNVSTVFSQKQKEKLRLLIGGRRIERKFELSTQQKKSIKKLLKEDLETLKSNYGINLMD